MDYQGNLIITKENQEQFKDIKSVKGNIDIREGATLNAPLLKESGNIHIREGATIQLPNLKESGYIFIREGATLNTPLLNKSGGIYFREGATLNTPLLNKSGDIHIREGAIFTLKENVKINNFNKFFGDISKMKFEVVDGIACQVILTRKKDDVVIKRARKTVFKDGKIVGDIFYIASKDCNNAHGKTAKEAMEELAFKTSSRDLSQFKDIKLEDKKTPNEWGLIYRAITGACKLGVDDFKKQKGKLKRKYSLEEIIQETQGAYGSEKFINFFKKVVAFN